MAIADVVSRLAEVRKSGTNSLIVLYEDGEALFFKLPNFSIIQAIRILSGAHDNKLLLERVILRDAAKIEIENSEPLTPMLESSTFWRMLRKTFE